MIKTTPNELAFIWSKKARLGYDYVVAIDGRKSSGKTTLGAWLSYCYKWMPLKPYNLVEESFKKLVLENIVYTANLEEQMRRVEYLYQNLPRYDSILVDESKVFYKQDWQTEANKKLVKMLGEVRKLINPSTGENVGNKMLVLCQDNFLDFTKGIRDSVNVWIRMVGRGVGAIFMPDPTPAYDKWHIDEYERVKREVLKKSKVYQFLDVNQQVKLYARHPCFVGIITFPPMPKQAEQEYLKLDALAKMEKYATDDSLSRTDKRRQHIIGYLSRMLIQRGITPEEIYKEVKGYGEGDSKALIKNAMESVKNRQIPQSLL